MILENRTKNENPLSIPKEDMIFEEQVFGGSVPKNYFPAVEKSGKSAIIYD